MSDTITAVYENGVLRPLTPLALPEHTEVQISIQVSTATDGQEHRRRVIDLLAAAGLIAPGLNTSASLPLSEEERNELAHRLPAGRPLSAIIIEEREGC